MAVFSADEQIIYENITNIPKIVPLNGSQIREYYSDLPLQRAVANIIWRLNGDTEKSVREEFASVFGDEKYYFKYPFSISRRTDAEFYALHVRRGDKLLETAYHPPLKRYVETLEKMIRAAKRRELSQSGRKPAFEKPLVFVASDHVTSIIDELRRTRPAWTFLVRKSALHSNSNSHSNSSSSSNSTGHVQKEFNALSESERTQKSIELIQDLEFLRRARFLVCTYSSHICFLSQMLRDQDPKSIQSLDSIFEELWPAG